MQIDEKLETMECKRDTLGNVYPEFCVNTNRYDHNLHIDELADMWKRATKE